MNSNSNHDERIASMTFASVYPHYLLKVEKKGRTKEELSKVIEWLTGFDEAMQQELIEGKVTFQTFFQKAEINPNAHLYRPYMWVSGRRTNKSFNETG